MQAPRIILCMRRMLSAFLLVLLALRGLAGDAMAMGSLPGMASSTAALPATLHMATENGHHAATHSPVDAISKGPHSAAPGSTCGDGNAAGCGAFDHDVPCAACAVCHVTLSVTTLRLAPGAAPPHVRPQGGSAHFASAPPQQPSKPPISAV